MSSGKLVRDRIPELISADGRTPVVEELSGPRLINALYAKLNEEQAELLAASSPEDQCEEIADIIEVLFTLAAQYGCGEGELMNIVVRKRAERGGFSEGLYLQRVTS
jgi:predicted house-cleaning noncanonical NTP pyrophosphatase (MazG superfamily)